MDLNASERGLMIADRQGYKWRVKVSVYSRKWEKVTVTVTSRSVKADQSLLSDFAVIVMNWIVLV